jgi:hypothetical protein
MDDLVHYCLRELSFDGDLGECIYHVMAFSEKYNLCAWVRIPYSTSHFILVRDSFLINTFIRQCYTGSNVSRLKDFIIDFYVQPEARYLQNPDDAFCAFVWSLVVRQPTIRVGTIPKGLTSGVWIAPQTSKKKKAKERGEEHIDVKHPELDLIPDATSRSLESLVEEFGDRLRIAVEPNAIYAAITGSHIRVCNAYVLFTSCFITCIAVCQIEPNGIFCSSDRNARKGWWCFCRFARKRIWL